jgi:hypothetical protein
MVSPIDLGLSTLDISHDISTLQLRSFPTVADPTRTPVPAPYLDLFSL